jgi:hypothetical protein
MHRRFPMVTMFSYAKLTNHYYKQMASSLLETHQHLELYLTTTSCSLFHSFSSSCEQRLELLGELVSLEERTPLE